MYTMYFPKNVCLFKKNILKNKETKNNYSICLPVSLRLPSAEHCLLGVSILLGTLQVHLLLYSDILKQLLAVNIPKHKKMF